MGLRNSDSLSIHLARDVVIGYCSVVVLMCLKPVCVCACVRACARACARALLVWLEHCLFVMLHNL